MRRSLAATVLAATAFATPALAIDPVKYVKDTIKECMDCIPPACQIAGGCKVSE